MSKQLATLLAANPDKLDDAYRDDDGVWLHLKAGWCNEPSTHTIHESTVREVIAAFRDVRPCTCCAECQAVHPELPASAFPHPPVK